jgi:hypothetical protein
MKKLILVLLLIACADLCKAQYSIDVFKIPAKSKNIFISSKDASLDIVGYDGDDLVIQAFSEAPVPKAPSAASGLTLISSGTVTDGSFKPEIKQETDKVLSINIPRSGFKNIRVLVPKNAYLNVIFASPVKPQTTSSTDRPQTKISLSKLRGELDIIGSASIILLNDVTGPITIDAKDNGLSTASAQKVIITNFNPAKTNPAQNGKPKPLINIIARYADVDISLPRDIKANIRGDITYGDLYSDLFLAATDEGSAKGQYTGILNGGGNIISIYAGYGNVYIRQQKPLLK